MSSERDMRQRVVSALRPLHAFSVENAVGVGTPDVHCVAGWIELKAVAKWPEDAQRPVRINHFTKGQRLWHRTHFAAGGRSWVLLKVGADWLLFTGNDAALFLGEGLTRQGCFSMAKWTTATSPGPVELGLRNFLMGEVKGCSKRI